MVGAPLRLHSLGQEAGDVLNSPLTPRKVVMTLALVILCLQLIYVLLIPWLPEMEAYAAASGQM